MPKLKSIKMRSVLRQLLVLMAALLMAVASYQIPFLLAGPVVIETSNYQHEDAGETNEEIQALVEKGSLSDEELLLLTQKMEEIAALNAQGAGDSEKPDTTAAHIDARTSGVLWLIPLWGVFFLLLPRTKLEFIETVALPVFFYFVGAILIFEIAIILTLGLVFYLLKNRIIRNRQ